MEQSLPQPPNTMLRPPAEALLLAGHLLGGSDNLQVCLIGQDPIPSARVSCAPALPPSLLPVLPYKFASRRPTAPPPAPDDDVIRLYCSRVQ